jgi:hypothetical protein
MPRVPGITPRTTIEQERPIAATVLALINAVRREAGEGELESLPVGSRRNPQYNCPIARALTALIVPEERRISFHHPWHAAAATKLWKVPFTDTLLLSVEMPEAIYEFAVAFRAGNLPELEEDAHPSRMEK